MWDRSGWAGGCLACFIICALRTTQGQVRTPASEDGFFFLYRLFVCFHPTMCALQAMSADEATGLLLEARRIARAALNCGTSASTAAEHGLRLRAIQKSRSPFLSPSLTRTLQEVGTEVPHPSRASEPLPLGTETPHVTETSLAWWDVVAKDPTDLGPSNEAVETDKDTVTYCQQETVDSHEHRNLSEIADDQGEPVTPPSPRLAALAASIGIAHHRLDALGITGVRDMAFGWNEDEIAAQLSDCGRRLHSSALFLPEGALQTRVRNEVRGRIGQPPPLPIPTLQAPVARPPAREALRPLQPGLRVARSVPTHSVGTDFEANLARALAAPVLDTLKANLQHSTKRRQILNVTTEHAEQFLIVTGDFLASFSPDSLGAALAAWRRWGLGRSPRKLLPGPAR